MKPGAVTGDQSLASNANAFPRQSYRDISSPWDGPNVFIK
jgi:hypothetical protein